QYVMEYYEEEFTKGDLINLAKLAAENRRLDFINDLINNYGDAITAEKWKNIANLANNVDHNDDVVLTIMDAFRDQFDSEGILIPMADRAMDHQNYEVVKHIMTDYGGYTFPDFDIDEPGSFKIFENIAEKAVNLGRLDLLIEM